MSPSSLMRVGRLLVTGVRGAVPGDPQLEADLDCCARIGVGGILLFDVDVPTWRRAVARGVDPDEARWQAERNIRSPGQLKTLIGYLRERLGADILVLVDQEGGSVARLRPERGFRQALPSAAEFAARSGTEQRTLADRQARELAELGIDVNLAPVIDVGHEPEAVLVGQQRVLGHEPRRVLASAQAVIDAHSAAGVHTCVKHFPGLGSVRRDTHQMQARLDERYDRAAELAPYRELISGPRPPAMVMAAHVIWPEVDPGRVVSQSRAALQGVLRDELGFEGVIATDSLDMAGADGSSAEQAATRPASDSPQVAAVRALEAGADLLIHAANLRDGDFDDGHPIERVARALTAAVEAGRVLGGWGEIDRRAECVHALRARSAVR